MSKNQNKIINGFCYLRDESVIFIDLVTEKSKEYSYISFDQFIKDNKIDEYHIFLANKEYEKVTPLYKYRLESNKTNTPIKAKDRKHDELIDVCYKICIEISKIKKESSLS